MPKHLHRIEKIILFFKKIRIFLFFEIADFLLDIDKKPVSTQLKYIYPNIYSILKHRNKVNFFCSCQQDPPNLLLF